MSRAVKLAAEYTAALHTADKLLDDLVDHLVADGTELAETDLLEQFAEATAIAQGTESSTTALFETIQIAVGVRRTLENLRGASAVRVAAATPDCRSFKFEAGRAAGRLS